MERVDEGLGNGGVSRYREVCFALGQDRGGSEP